MALSFPSDPINGAVSGEYTYDATKTAWRKNAALPVSVTHSDVAPSNPRAGDQWWKSNEGTLFTYYNDGTSSQWVESTNVVANVEPNPIPAGAMMAWASDVVPANWLLCDGAAVSRSTYASLFAAIGTQYGSGDGTTTFNLPNLKGRTIVGKDSTQTEFDVLGETGGAKTHTLTISEMPSHTHSNTLSSNVVASSAHRHEFKISMLDSGNYSPAGPNAGWGSGTGTAGAYRYSTGQWQGGLLNGSVSATGENYNAASTRTLGRYDTTGDTTNPTETATVGITNASAGSGAAHNNLQPYIVLNYIIKFSAGETPGDSQLAVRVGAIEAANNATPLSQNYVINGAMDWWQRGTSGLTGTGFQADRWYHITSVNPTATRSVISPGTSGVPESVAYALDWSGSSVGTTGYNYLNQRIEDVHTLAGKTATLSFYAKGSTSGTIGISFTQSFGAGGSADVWITGSSISISTVWQRYSVTVTVPSLSGKTIGTPADSFLQVRFVKGLGSSYDPSIIGLPALVDYTGTVSITAIQLEEGPYATPFRRNAPSIQAELAACQRYYALVGSNSATVAMTAFASTDGNLASCWTLFPVTMRTTPSTILTYDFGGNLGNAHRQYVGSGGGSNVAVAINGKGPNGFGVNTNIGVTDRAGMYYLWYKADAEL